MHIFNDNKKVFYSVFGDQGDWIVIANAPGMTNKFFYPIIKLLEAKFRIMIWDYRGISPSDNFENIENLNLEHHTADLMSICNELNISKAHFMGWCIGPKVFLNLYNTRPNMCRTFTFINFSYNTIDKWDEITDFDKSIIKVSKLLMENKSAGKRMIKLIKEMQDVSDYDNLLELVDEFDNKGEILDLIYDLDQQSNLSNLSLNRFELDSDLINYFVIYNNFITHDCLDIILKISIPTLILGGDKDSWTPPRMFKKLNEIIDGSRYVNVENKTHYLLLEDPHTVVHHFLELINDVA